MATALEELQRLNKAQGSVLNQRPNPNARGAVPRRPPVASGLERVLKQPGELAAEASTARGAGQIAGRIGDVLTGGPILRAGSQVLEQVQPALQQFSAGLTGREPGQPAANIVQPSRLGATTQDAIQAIPQEAQPTPPTTVAGVGTRAAPRGGATDASRFLNTVAGNRQAAIDAGGIQVIRGLQSSIDTPAASRFGSQIIPESQFQPGGLPGRETLARAGGSTALAQSQAAAAGNVEAAARRVGGAVQVQRLKNEGAAQEAEQVTIEGRIADLGRLKAFGNLSEAALNEVNKELEELGKVANEQPFLLR